MSNIEMLLGHVGGWAMSLVYAAPVVVVGGIVAVGAWRDRRSRPD